MQAEVHSWIELRTIFFHDQNLRPRMENSKQHLRHCCCLSAHHYLYFLRNINSNRRSKTYKLKSSMRSFWAKKPPNEDASSSSSLKDDRAAQAMNPEDWPWVWALRDTSVLDWKRGLTDNEIQAQILHQQRLPVEILPGKEYLGNAQSIPNTEDLQELGITAVLNMAGPMALQKEQQKALKDCGITYLPIIAKDEDAYPLLDKHWEEAYYIICASVGSQTEAISAASKKCVAGINRSVLIVCAYYMLVTKTLVLETAKHVRRQRGNVALCNEGFQEQLVALARQHNLLGNQPGDPGSIVPESPRRHLLWKHSWKRLKVKRR